MNADLTRFAEAMARNPELKQEFIALAARYGVDLSDAQLSDDELGKVAGGKYDQSAKNVIQSMRG